jgi:hypothetical protein
LFSTHSAAFRAALKTFVSGALVCALMLTLAAPAGAAGGKPHRSPCANLLCTKDVQRTPSCWRFDRRKKVARCFISRAAAHYGQSKSQAYYIHYGQSKSQAYYIAWRESRYNWRVTNSSSGTAGLYQFARQTWRSTPYRNKSPYHPRWAALAAMWMWKHGGYSHWNA